MKPSFHKAGAPALATAISLLVRTSAIPGLLIGSAALSGCAHKVLPPDISYDDMTPAMLTGDPPAPVEVVEVPKLLPSRSHPGGASTVNGTPERDWRMPLNCHPSMA